MKRYTTEKIEVRASCFLHRSNNSIISSNKMSTVDLIANDPILVAMAKGDIPWGDLLISSKDDNAPVLKMRKDIWTAFPVNLIPLGTDADGAERHAVAWDYARFTSDTNLRESENSTRERLLSALQASTKWVVESMTCKYCICVIRMVFNGYQPTERRRGTTLKAIADIYKFFPAVVHSVNNGANNGSNGAYSIELHSKRIEKLSEIKGYDVSEEVRSELLCALKASNSWRVLSARLPCEVCRIEIASIE